jgi:hypothetical protein
LHPNFFLILVVLSVVCVRPSCVCVCVCVCVFVCVQKAVMDVLRASLAKGLFFR